MISSQAYLFMLSLCTFVKFAHMNSKNETWRKQKCASQLLWCAYASLFSYRIISPSIIPIAMLATTNSEFANFAVVVVVVVIVAATHHKHASKHSAAELLFT